MEKKEKPRKKHKKYRDVKCDCGADKVGGTVSVADAGFQSVGAGTQVHAYPFLFGAVEGPGDGADAFPGLGKFEIEPV